MRSTAVPQAHDEPKRSRPAHPAATAVAAVAALALTSACDPLPATTVTTPSSVAPTSAAPTPGAPVDDPAPVGAGDPRPKQSSAYPGTEHPAASLTDVRAVGHQGFDRIVLQFTGPMPGYRVEYIDAPITEDASGDTVPVEGTAFLYIQTAPASGFDLEGEQVRETYTGPDRVIPTDGNVVTEVVRTGDFEAQLGWVAGTRGRRPFAVATLTDPPRLVVDVLPG